jgi:hypothetical protein
MATEARSNVTVAISVVDKATPAIESITTSLNKVEAAQQQINETSAKMAAQTGSAYPELAKMAQQNIWNLHVRGDDVVPDIGTAAQGQVQEAQSAIAALGDTAEQVWRKIKGGFTGAFESIVGTAKRIGATLGPIFQTWLPFGAGFAVSAILDAFTGGMRDLVATVDKLGPQAKNIGITVQELQRLTEWAKESGAPVKTVTAGLEELTKTLGAVEQGTGPGSKRAGKAIADLLGEDWSGKGKSPVEVLKEMAAAFQAIDDPQRRAADAAGIFTGKWKEMLPLLMQGPEAIDKAVETSKKLGEISPDMQKAAEDYTQAMAQLGRAWASLKEDIGAQGLPIVTPAIKELTDFLAEHREDLVAIFRGMAEGVIGFFREVGPVLASTAHDLVEIKNVVQWIGDKMPTLKGPDFHMDVDPITKVRDAMITGLEKVKALLDTPLPDIWAGIATNLSHAWDVIQPILERFWNILQQIAKWTGFGGVTDSINAVAGAVGKAADAWERWKGTTATTPAPGVSPGGGPIAWEDLAGARGGIVPPAAPNGEVKVTIENKNPPPGTRTSATATGPGVSADVGQSMPWTVPSYSGPWSPAGA